MNDVVLVGGFFLSFPATFEKKNKQRRRSGTHSLSAAETWVHYQTAVLLLLSLYNNPTQLAVCVCACVYVCGQSVRDCCLCTITLLVVGACAKELCESEKIEEQNNKKKKKLCCLQ